MQLDIFEHSRDVMLRNDVLHALLARDAIEARAAWRRFSAELPGDDTLPALALLVATLEPSDKQAFADAGDAHAALQQLRDAIEPAAHRLLGSAAGATWLVPLWQEMAQRCARLAYSADDSAVHAAPLWLVAGDWAAAAQAVATIESWRRIPAPLAWMAEAQYRVHGLQPIWALLAELAWLSPRRFDGLTKRLADPQLQRLRRAFDAAFEGNGNVDDLAWLPAWSLTERPELATAWAKAQPALHTPPERAMRLLIELLGLEKQGRHRELMEHRKSLRDLHVSLFVSYMSTR